MSDQEEKSNDAFLACPIPPFDLRCHRVEARSFSMDPASSPPLLPDTAPVASGLHCSASPASPLGPANVRAVWLIAVCSATAQQEMKRRGQPIREVPEHDLDTNVCKAQIILTPPGPRKPAGSLSTLQPVTDPVLSPELLPVHSKHDFHVDNTITGQRC